MEQPPVDMSSPPDHLPPDPGIALARRLVDARRTNIPIRLDAVADVIPADFDRARDVDDLVAEAMGQAERGVVGWKIGCTSAHAQQLMATDGPFPGRVYDLHRLGPMPDGDGGADPVPAIDMPAVALLEGEFAFTLARDLAPTGDAVDRDRVIAALGWVHPAIEVVGGHYDRFLGAPPSLVLADAGANLAVVIGPGRPLGSGPDQIDPARLPAMGATMTLDGAVTGQGSGADVLGDPIAAMVWLASELSRRWITLAAGQVVTTGTATQVTTPRPGARATLTIDGLGSTSVDVGSIASA